MEEIKNELQIFNNPEFGQVRTIEIDGVPWFVAKDVASALGYVNTKAAITRHVAEENIRVLNQYPNENKEISQQAKLINETGVISLALMSELPSAKKFRHWISKEVIPSIIRTGSYNAPSLTNAELIAKIANDNVERDRRIMTLEQSQATIEQKLDTAVKIFATSDKSWKEAMEITLKDMAGSRKFDMIKLRGKLYKELEAGAGVDLQDRLTRRRNRMQKNGASSGELKAVTKLDIISFDKKLRPIFESIIKKHQALHATQEAGDNHDQ